MHQPDTTPHRSSYFDYRILPYRRPADFDASPPATHPVVIVGAGPIGLTLAILLAEHGVRAVVVDGKAQVSGGSRAAALTRRSMEIMALAGVAERFMAKALLWDAGQSFYRGSVVHDLKMPRAPGDRFPAMINLPQCFMEDILVERAMEAGVDLRFQTIVTGVGQTDAHAEVTLDTPDGPYQLRAEWLVACDGGTSTVRRLQGLRFEGNSFESRFLISDLRIGLKEPAGRRCYFGPPWAPDCTVIMHQLHPDIWRLDYQLPDDVSDEDALDPDRVRRQIQAHFDYIGVTEPWSVEWVTLYRPNALTLPDYRNGRTIFCGDAAHLLPVFGVRGMNTGLQDVANLAWKLAHRLEHGADIALLDSYTIERIGDARQICVEASRSTRMVAPPTRGFEILQQAVLSLSLSQPFIRDLLHWRTSRPIDYHDSPLTIIDDTETTFRGGPTPGALPQDARLGDGGATRHLSELLLEPTFHVLMFGSDDRLTARTQAGVAEARRDGTPVRLIAIGSPGCAATADVVVPDPDGRLAEAWGVTAGVYILRPDQHVGARWTSASPRNIAETIRHLAGRLATAQAEIAA